MHRSDVDPIATNWCIDAKNDRKHQKYAGWAYQIVMKFVPVQAEISGHLLRKFEVNPSSGLGGDAEQTDTHTDRRSTFSQ